MISVCMATYNGAKYIFEQITSILPQLAKEDELIISDDGSNDETIKIIKSFEDPRIKLFLFNARNHILNFENALCHAKGDYIFLSDQDDVWLEGRVEKMLLSLKRMNLVSCDGIPTDKNLSPIANSIHTRSKRTGFINNFIHNNYTGCCLAFDRRVLQYSLPFPKGLITHDTWIGLIAEIVGKTEFIDDKLFLFRRHDQNVSVTAKTNVSQLSLKTKLCYRFVILKGIFNNIILKKKNV